MAFYKEIIFPSNFEPVNEESLNTSGVWIDAISSYLCTRRKTNWFQSTKSKDGKQDQH